MNSVDFSLKDLDKKRVLLLNSSYPFQDMEISKDLNINPIEKYRLHLITFIRLIFSNKTTFMFVIHFFGRQVP